MKKLLGSMAVRFAATAAFAAVSFVLFLSAAAFAFLVSFDAYYDDGKTIGYRITEDAVHEAEREITDALLLPLTRDGNADALPFLRAKYDESNIKLCFADGDGNILFENDVSGEAGYSFRETLRAADVDVTVTGYVKKSLTAHDRLYYLTRLTRYLVDRRYLVGTVCVLSAAGFAALLFFLICAAGHRGNTSDITLSPVDRVPFELLAAGIFLLDWFIVRVFLFLYAFVGRGELLTVVGIGAVCFIAALLPLLGLVLSFAARSKAGTLIRNTLLYRAAGMLRQMYVSFALYKKAALVYGGVSLVEGVIVYFSRSRLLTLLWIGERLVTLVFVCLAAADIKTIFSDVSEIAHGHIDGRKKTVTRLKLFQSGAEAVSSVGEGLKSAIEERTKADRLRTELITNVSHDLKTPLTSVLGYVDVMKKEPMSESAKQYLSVIEKQSLRLKKLTVDLIEASKAASGCVELHEEKIDLCLMLTQALSEYADRMAAAELETVRADSTANAYVTADAEILWRVLDNLLGNAVKYAMPGTRLYADIAADGDIYILTLRNISRAPLGLSAEELTERFVRGDASRHTEGSGLGLSIADSLMKLLGGEMKLSVEGDMFKVILTFDAAGEA